MNGHTMPFSMIARSVSTGIQRNLTISDLKHEAKIDDLKRELARSTLTRATEHGRKLTEARLQHATWQATLTPEGVQCYQASLADIEAIVNPVTPSE
jgi:hypothetical protein